MFNKILNLKKNKEGVTLIEMVVSVALFAIVMLAATGIFQMVIEGQRNSITSQNVQESVRYAFEVMSKEMRMAQKDDGKCCPTADKLYCVDSNELSFKNRDELCVTYQLDGNRLKITRGGTPGYITPDEIKVSDLEFRVQGDPSVGQPVVIMKMKVDAIGKEMHNQEIVMQTAVSARYYE